MIYNKDGLKFLTSMPDDTAKIVFFDPQYRGVYEHLQFGNEDKSYNPNRVELPQMDDELITKFNREISRVLMPSGHLFLWLDKFHLCTNFHDWLKDIPILRTVDLLTWDKQKLGMGYRTRHVCEFLLIIQKEPKRVKDVWVSRDIPDIWSERISNKKHTHAKPVKLQAKLIEAVSKEDDLVLDPAAGSFSVLDSCIITKRKFIGNDIDKKCYQDVKERMAQTRLQ